eukprot:Gb_29098 [translate_table: standard]
MQTEKDLSAMVDKRSNVVELKVAMNCEGCEKAVRKSLSKLQGVERVDIDINQQKVTVRGSAEPEKVLKKMKKSGKRAEFWVEPTKFSDACVNNVTSSPQGSSSNIYRGNIGDGIQAENAPLQTAQVMRAEDNVTNLFSDDNPNACSLM